MHNEPAQVNPLENRIVHPAEEWMYESIRYSYLVNSRCKGTTKPHLAITAYNEMHTYTEINVS